MRMEGAKHGRTHRRLGTRTKFRLTWIVIALVMLVWGVTLVVVFCCSQERSKCSVVSEVHDISNTYHISLFHLVERMGL